MGLNMRLLLFLLLSCETLLAQRTPLRINGVVVSNPNLTNSASVTYSVNGTNITATAAGGGGDAFWTNSATQPAAIQPIGGTNVFAPGTMRVGGLITNDASQAHSVLITSADKVISSLTPAANPGAILVSQGAGVSPTFNEFFLAPAGSTNASLAGNLTLLGNAGVGVAPVAGTTLAIQGTTSDDTAFLIKGFDSSTRQTLKIFNEGRMDLTAFSNDGGILSLYLLDSSPSNDNRLGHYAFGGNSDSGTAFVHTWALIEARQLNITETNMSSYINFKWMEGINGSPGGTYAYQQPNMTASIGSNGFVMPKPLVIGTNPATSGTIRIPNSESIRARNGANTLNVDLIRANSLDTVEVGGANAAIVSFRTANADRAFINSSGLNGATANSQDVGTSSFPFRTGRFATSVLAASVTSTNGFSSTASDAAVTIASTGWTNTFGKNAVVYMDSVAGITYTVYNNALTAVYTNGTVALTATVILQPAGKVIITGGTLGVGRATPF